MAVGEGEGEIGTDGWVGGWVGFGGKKEGRILGRNQGWGLKETGKWD